MITAANVILERNADEYAARIFADTILHLLSDYIADTNRRDVWELLAKTSHEQKFELTTAAMRKEYEAWKRAEIAPARVIEQLMGEKDGE